jgi:thiol:disulfide interchange protein DsbD
MGVWMWGEFVQRGQKRRWLGALGSVGVVALVGFIALTQREEIQWKPWSREAVAQARREGRPVLVDFTADWCVTCKLNKRTSLEVDSVREKLLETGTVTLRADWTLRDQTITEELARFGRNAVPLVVVYPRDPDQRPMELPPVLTPDIVLNALEAAAQTSGGSLTLNAPEGGGIQSR